MTKATYRRKSLRSGGTAHHGWKGVAARVEVSGHATHTARKEKEVEADVPVTHTARKQKEMKVDVMFFSLFSFIQFRTTKHGMVLPTFRVDSLSSVSPLWKYPYTHAQRCLSWVIPHLVTV